MKVKVICIHGIGKTKSDFALSIKSLLTEKDEGFKEVDFVLAYWDDLAQKIQEYYNIKDNLNKILSFIKINNIPIDLILKFIGDSLLDLYLFFDDTDFFSLTEERIAKILIDTLQEKENGLYNKVSILSHSLGTVIAYTLAEKIAYRIPPPPPQEFDYFITFATPLGCKLIQRRINNILKNKSGLHRHPFDPKIPLSINEEGWINIRNKKDPIASNEAIIDASKSSLLNWQLDEIDTAGVLRFKKNIILDFSKDPHSLYEYLSQPEVISTLKEILL